MNADPRLLSTDDVARRLGVKPATVYAYVSRGLLSSRRNADGKGSLFAKEEVDAFLAGRRPGTTPAIQTGVTLIRDGHLHFRGRDACELARTVSFESVVSLLWTGELEHVALRPAPDVLRVASAAEQTLPATARLTDRLQVIVAAGATADPLRFGTSPAAVVATGRALLATMVTALPTGPADARPRWEHRDEPGNTNPGARAARELSGEVPLAEILWHRLAATRADSAARAANAGRASGGSVGAGRGRGRDGSGGADVDYGMSEPTEREHLLLNAALVLLADHDLAASTLAARVAASTRAHPYAVVSAGLAALDGPLHGGLSGIAHLMLAEALERDDPVGSIADRLREGGSVPGFDHPLYPEGDPRATTLLGLLADGPVKDCATELIDAMRTRSGAHPNIDFALATLTLQHDLSPDAGEAIFAVARTAGWLAHALEEYADRPSRFRPSGRYAGRPPTA
jgi:citrate synthase